ncbi:two-component sensor histidine kinase [Aliidongia dinghuensis]|uniref:histidine kinase n=1 Tax=Aliidongia dinghuensis TaxID=1867774 RepID=A0A8J2YVV4_9PROT|nr:sensor histidine kinase KdpD [Aliidongia dinghuensis]GGF27139.1 two-component sensor histidine kinase [Aliidongia dinghuensis]
MSDPADRDQRPDPEALLAAAEKEGRGRLKIFLGAAPGVGKTYEMLKTAQKRHQEGVDVVVGIVETHGRSETAALVEGLEVIPRRQVEYRGRQLDEMDLDAILKRRPKLVLVDELAHTNAPGSRHAKRYLDVDELLTAGIDVYTTLNIQHVESLNDVVAQITRIRVRETLPDSFLDKADEIEVIDLTPEDLMERLREGKVYVRDQAQRALKHYFSPGNLTALRELALRRTAQRVDDQMLSYMREHAISGPWAAGERIMVCISEAPNTPGLIRYARRVADRLRVKWTAIYVEGPRSARLTEPERNRVADHMRLAEKLGADLATIPGSRVVDQLIGYAQANNITQIIIGKSDRSRWFEILHGSVVHDLVRRAGSISIHVMAGDPIGERTDGDELETKAAPRPFDPKPYWRSAIAVAAALGAGLGIDQVLPLPLPNISLVFLTAVLFAAVTSGLGPSLFAALLSVLAYNFFFLPPLYTFTIADPANVLALVAFMIVAVIASNLASRTRDQAITAARRANTTAELYAFSRKLAGTATLDDVLWATAYQVAFMLKVRVVMLLPDGDGRLEVRAGYPPEDELDDADFAAARWTWDRNHPAGRGSDTLPGGKRLFLPLRTGRGAVGVIGIDRDAPGPLLTPDERRLLDALADQAAIAIERTRLAEDIDEARLLAETERLRSALLTSISHDLRTPLASIIGAITSLRSYGERYGAETRGELMATVQDEAERLNRFVGNLLDMTRLESGALELKSDYVDMSEIVGTALDRTAKIMHGHRVEIDLAVDLPMVKLDAVLMEQVLVNLLDNAAKYAPVGTTVKLEARHNDDEIVIDVVDEGPGIPQDALERVFDKFYRVRQGDRQRAGTGLGLAICRGFVEALGGRITATNRTDRAGAILRITFPKALAASVELLVGADHEV